MRMLRPLFWSEGYFYVGVFACSLITIILISNISLIQQWKFKLMSQITEFHQLKDKQEAFTAAISKQVELESWRKMNDLELKRLKLAVDSEAGESKSKNDEIELLRCNLEKLDSELDGKNAELRNQRLILDELKNEKTILLDQIEMRKVCSSGWNIEIIAFVYWCGNLLRWI